jgi:hypothetical protein
MNEQQMQKIWEFQKDEITGYHLYDRLADRIKDPNNAKILREMSAAEFAHYQFWKKISGKEVPPDSVKIFFYTLMFRLLGLTFSVKLMEKGEKAGVKEYEAFDAVVPGAAKLGHEEQEHEDALSAMIKEDFLSYIGSIVLGLNDAMVELTAGGSQRFDHRHRRGVLDGGFQLSFRKSGSQSKCRSICSLYRRGVFNHRGAVDPALPAGAPGQFRDLYQPGIDIIDHNRHHFRFQFLHIRGKGYALQTALP